jgi:hypothetical protein
MYRVDAGQDEPLYQTSGWYSRQVLFWLDPEYIVRTGGEPAWLSNPPHSYVALAFYRNGKLTRQYSVLELVPEKDLDRSVSHYRYFKRIERCRGAEGPEVRVETSAGTEIFFDFTDGRRVSGDGSLCPGPAFK